MLLYENWSYENFGITNKRFLTSYLRAASKSACVFTCVTLHIHIQVYSSPCLFKKQFLFPNQSTVCAQVYVYHICCGDMKVCVRERIPALKIVILYLGRQDIYSHEEFSVPEKLLAVLFLLEMWGCYHLPIICINHKALIKIGKKKINPCYLFQIY